MTADGLGWLLLLYFRRRLAGTKAAMGGRRMAAAMVEKCIWRLNFLVFCVQFYAGIIIVVVENRLISNINQKTF